MTLYARLAALIVIVLALAGAWWKLELALKDREQIGYDRRAQQDKAAAEAQTARNRDMQRAAELHYTVAAQGQTRYITRVAQEAHDAASPLAACPVPDPVRVRLNAAAGCARGDSAGACGAGDEVPGAR